MPETLTPEAIIAAGEQIIAAGESSHRAGRDPVNQPMINNWLEAIGDKNPVYVDEDAARAAGFAYIVAPLLPWRRSGPCLACTASGPRTTR